MRPIEKSGDLGVTNLEQRRAGDRGVLHDADLAEDLTILVELPTIFSQGRVVTLMLKINLVE